MFNNPAITKINDLRTQAAARGFDVALIEQAATWISTFQRECGPTWNEPDYVFYDNAHAEIQLSWYGARNLGIGISLQKVGFIAAGKSATGPQRVCGTLSTQQERMSLWQWFRTQKIERCLARREGEHASIN